MKTIKTFPLLLVAALIFNCIQPEQSLAQNLQGELLKDSLLNELRKAKDDTSKIKTLYSLAWAFASNDSLTALNYANQCMNISKQVHWTRGIGLAHMAFAQVYYELSDYTVSLQNGQRACEIFKSLGDKKKMGSAFLMIANNYNELGYYTKAIENHFEALRLFEVVNDKHGIAKCHNNIGNCYYYISEFDKAVENYNKAVAAFTDLNNKHGIASALDNMSSVFVRTEKYDSADFYNLQALKIFEEINDQRELSRVYFNRGNVLINLGDAKSTYEFYMRAAEIDKRLGIETELAHDYGGIGELYLQVATDTGKKFILSPILKAGRMALLEKARDYFYQALSLGKQTGDINLMMYYTNLASETEEMLGNYNAALAYSKEHILYKDSIFNNENKRKIEALEKQRISEVKDEQIKILAKDKALQASEIKRQMLVQYIILATVAAVILISVLLLWSYNRRKKTVFEKQVMDTEMKALRAQMNPHFIFNSLHSINKYILENNKDNASMYLSKFAKLMRLILENSREQYVTLDQDLQALELYIELEALRFQNRFQYLVQIDEHIDKTNVLVPPLLLQPFVENAVMHGLQQKEGGLIKIKINAVNDMMRCIVEDNGVGRQEAVITEQAKQKSRKSLGLKITQERLDIINRLRKVKTYITFFDVTDEENKPGGLRVELLLPLQQAF